MIKALVLAITVLFSHESVAKTEVLGFQGNNLISDSRRQCLRSEHLIRIVPVFSKLVLYKGDKPKGCHCTSLLGWTNRLANQMSGPPFFVDDGFTRENDLSLSQGIACPPQHFGNGSFMVKLNTFPNPHIKADLCGRGLPEVFNQYLREEHEHLAAILHSDQLKLSKVFNGKCQPWPLVVSHDLVGSPHFGKGGVDHDDRDYPQNQSSGGGPSHDLREEGHFLLRIKVLIGAIMVAGGFYLLMNTVPKGYALKRKTFAINTILGVLYVVLGALFSSYSLFSLLGG